MMDDLNDLFAAARGADAQPSDALMARVLADATAVQPKATMMVRAVPQKSGFWAGLAALFGGGGVLAGLGSVAMAGFYLGFMQPAPLLALTDVWVTGASVDSVDLMPGIDALLTED
jgi:hypothetical protein